MEIVFGRISLCGESVKTYTGTKGRQIANREVRSQTDRPECIIASFAYSCVVHKIFGDTALDKSTVQQHSIGQTFRKTILQMGWKVNRNVCPIECSCTVDLSIA